MTFHIENKIRTYIHEDVMIYSSTVMICHLTSTHGLFLKAIICAQTEFSFYSLLIDLFEDDS